MLNEDEMRDAVLLVFANKQAGTVVLCLFLFRFVLFMFFVLPSRFPGACLQEVGSGACIIT
jgi:hypothetical protein